MVEVTQVDRALAADWNIECRYCSEYEGDYEADLAEAFARHRIAAMEEAAKVAEQTDTGWADARTFTAQKIAAAIRALKGPTDGPA